MNPETSKPPGQEIAKPEPASKIAMGRRGVELTTVEDAFRFARAVAESKLAPKGLDTPQQILVAIQTGMEAGLTPMASLRAIYVINGVPAWRGQDALSLVRKSGVCDEWNEGLVGEGDSLCAWVRSVRQGAKQPETTFSVADAKRARLWGKPGPWTEYPQRMLLWRARGFHAKDYYGDVLLGLDLAEEQQDHPPRQLRSVPTETTQRGSLSPAPVTAGVDPVLAELGAAEAPGDPDSLF